MNILSFKDWNKLSEIGEINEMAVINNIYDGKELNREQEWSKIKDSEFMTLLKQNVDSNHNDIYRYGTSTFFLIGKNKQYLGHIELDNNQIRNSFSKTKGLYYILFSHILSDKSLGIDKIYSDVSLSTYAIDAYEKLSKNNPNFNVGIYTNGSVEPFNRDLLLDNPNNVVVLYENTGFFNTRWELFQKQINENTPGTDTPSFMRQKYLNKDSFCDKWLYYFK